MKVTLLFTAVIVLFTSCTSSHINSKRIDQNAFPPDFKCNECILLVLKRSGGVNPKGINKYLGKSFRKNYSGKFEMATLEEITNNPKYADKTIYRFIISDVTWTAGNTTRTTSTTTSQNFGTSSRTEFQYNYAYSMDFYIYDRKIDKGYPSLGVSANVPAKAINRTSVLLNKKLTE